MKTDFRFIIGFLFVQFLFCALFFYVNINSDKNKSVPIAEQNVGTEEVCESEDANGIGDVAILRAEVKQLKLDVENLKKNMMDYNINDASSETDASVSEAASSDDAAEHPEQ